MCYRSFLLINTDMDVRWVPAIDGINIIGTGGRNTNKVGQCFKCNIIARPRPGFIAGKTVVGLFDPRIEEEVYCWPGASRADAVRGKGRTDGEAFSNDDVKAAYEAHGEEQVPLGIHGTTVAVDWDSCVAAGSCISVCPVQTLYKD